MVEIILGTGQQSSLRTIIRIGEKELCRTRGSPRKLVAHAPNIEVQASRPQFEGEFDAFAVRLRAQGQLLEAIKQFAGQAEPPCALAEVSGWQEIRCPATPGGPADAVGATLEKLSALLQLPEVWRVHGENFRGDHLSPELLFRAMIKFRASDVHLYPGAHPVFRVDNAARHSGVLDALSAEQILALIREIAPEKDWADFEAHKQCSFSYHQAGLGYSRVSAFIKATVPHCTLRFLPEVIPSFEDLHIPRPSMEKLARLNYGLVLVTGMTGSGKSTTVASLIDWINANESVHILTIEEPVEYVHTNKKSVVSQRDVGVDVATFSEGVKASLRHDPDVIVIGEMRDPDTIRAAINAAATGHLVVSTLHSNTASEVVNRIVSFFDPVERDLVRLQLRDAIKCIICQRLLPKVGGGRVPALEFLFNDTKHIADGILAGNTLAIKVGMQQTASDSFLFEENLLQLVKEGLISLEHGREHASDVSIFNQMRMGTYQVPPVEGMVHHHADGQH